MDKIIKNWCIFRNRCIYVGWGVNLNGVYISGRWFENEFLLYINVLEILVVKFVLLSLCYKMSYKYICSRFDNSLVVCYINN